MKVECRKREERERGKKGEVSFFFPRERKKAAAAEKKNTLSLLTAPVPPIQTYSAMILPPCACD